MLHQWLTGKYIDESTAACDQTKEGGQSGNGGKPFGKDDLQLVLGLCTTAESAHSEVTYSSMSWEGNRREDCVPVELSLRIIHYDESEHGGYDSHSLVAQNSSSVSCGQSSFLSESRSNSLPQFSNRKLPFSNACEDVVYSQPRSGGNLFSDDSEDMLCHDPNVHNSTHQRISAMLDEGSTSGAKRMKLRRNLNIAVGGMMHDAAGLFPIRTDRSFSPAAATEERSRKGAEGMGARRSCSSSSLVSNGEPSTTSSTTTTTTTTSSSSSSSSSTATTATTSSSSSSSTTTSSSSSGAGVWACSSSSLFSNGEPTASADAGVDLRPKKKMCKFPGCGTGARGTSGLCITHGGGRRCQRPDCSKGAESRSSFCKAHGGGPRCQSLGCLKSAEGRTEFCIAHGGGNRCVFEGCTKAARGKTGRCIRHGGGKRCRSEGCVKSAEGVSGLCISHGGGRRCQFPGCGKGAQGSTSFCKGHGGGKRCIFDRCTKGAEGSTLLCKAHGGGKRCAFSDGGENSCSKSVHGGTLFCVAHGGGKRCSVPGCTKSARGRTDCCVKHGGGKRCKFENCDKSAQGSTDFCKAHGGGKRCFWCRRGPHHHHHHQQQQQLQNPLLASDRIVALSGSSTNGKVASGACALHAALAAELLLHGSSGDCLSVNSSSLAHRATMPTSASSSGVAASEQSPSKSGSSSSSSLSSSEACRFQSQGLNATVMQCEHDAGVNKNKASVDYSSALPVDVAALDAFATSSGKASAYEPVGQKESSDGSSRCRMASTESSSALFSPQSSSMLMLSSPSLERRVHGGGLMALLAKEQLQ